MRCSSCNDGTGMGCKPVDHYDEYELLGYGTVSGEAAIMNEIYERGPVTCPIANTLELDGYTGGIFEDLSGEKD